MGGQLEPPDNIGLSQEQGRMTDGGNRLAGIKKGAHERDGLRQGTQLIRI